MSAYKQKPAPHEIASQPILYKIKMSPDGVTPVQQKKFDEMMNACKAVVDGLEHESSKKLCKLNEYHEAKIMEAIQFPKMHKEPLLEKTSHFMAESAFANVRVKNTIGASNEDRQAIVSLLKDLDVKDDAVMQDKLGLITVLENGEYKNPETVVYSKLYERYLQQLRTVLK